MAAGEGLEHDTVGWLATCEDDVPTGDAWLSAWERERAAGMRFTKRRTEFLTSRHTAKHALALALGEHPEPLARFEVRHHATGAPAPHVGGRPAHVAISMTDRADWAVTVVSRDGRRRLGCDLELVEPRTPAFVRDWFTPPEQALVAAATDADERDLLANLVWSAKESALKVLRTGLRRDTRSVVVALGDGPGSAGWSPLTVTTVEGDVMPGWWCRLGRFVVTFTADAAVASPTPLAPRATRIAHAVPRHSWMAAPRRDAGPPGPR